MLFFLVQTYPFQNSLTKVSYDLIRYFLPMTSAAVIMMIFLMMYWPSSVGSSGFELWNEISGNKISGIKAPDIWRNKSIIAKNVVLFVKKKIAISISQYPITITHASALRNGIQKTVSIISCFAGESSITFSKPNQKKITNSGRRIKKSFVLNLYIF